MAQVATAKVVIDGQVVAEILLEERVSKNGNSMFYGSEKVSPHGVPVMASCSLTVCKSHVGITAGKAMTGK